MSEDAERAATGAVVQTGLAAWRRSALAIMVARRSFFKREPGEHGRVKGREERRRGGKKGRIETDER